MSERLASWHTKLQAARKQTSRRQFVMEMGSWFPFSFYRVGSYLSRFPSDGERIGEVVDFPTYSAGVDQQQIDDPMSTGFFDQFGALLRTAVVAGTKTIGQNENSDYNDIILGAKDAYLNFVVLESEKVAYNYAVNGSDFVFNSLQVLTSHNVYQSRAVTNSSGVFFSSNVHDCDTIWFSANMHGCRECLGCSNLTNQSYCIKNTQYTEEEYFQRKQQILQSNMAKYDSLWQIVLGVQGSNQGESIDGQFNRKCQDIEEGYFNFQVSKGRNIIFGSGTGDATDVYDVFSFGGTTTDHNYGCMGVGWNASHVYCCVEASPSISHCYYSYLIDTCSYCLGCIGLKNKSYCIFNKQYTKEERYNKVDEIFTQMEQDDTLGQFFPGSMNPFYFNDTAAYLIDDSFTKEEVTAKGYLRRDEPIQVDIPEGATVVKTTELDQYEGFVISTEVERSTNTKPRFLDAASLHSKGHDEVVWYIDPQILKVIIQDEQGNVYRIVQMEYDFLLKYGLLLPRKHRLERMRENFRIN